MNPVRRFLAHAVMLAFHAGFVRPVLRVLGVRVRRRALVPTGPCLVVANHNSHLDAAVLMSLFPLRRLPRVHPVAAVDYFGKNLVRRTMAMVLMNGIPIERRPQAGVDPLGPIVQGIARGESFIFFPEGSRGEPGVVAPFRAGIGRLVRQVPDLVVVPVFLSGAERIWPRGEPIPVPLGIDVAVGKPRSYPRHKEATEIADEVREDVLALAPPPPPVPGPRPTPPLRVAVCSVLPGPQKRYFLAVLERLGRSGFTLGLSEPMLEADAEGVREASGVPRVRRRTWPSLLAWIFHRGGAHRRARFAEMVERARVDEALEHGRTTRFVATDGNALVDLLAFAEATFYAGKFEEAEMRRLLDYLRGERRIPLRQWPRFLRRATEVWLLNVLDLVRPPAPDILILLRFPSGELDLWQQRLQEAYAFVGGALRRRRVQVMEVDAGERSPAALAAEIEAALDRAAAVQAMT
jgi:1-acyl-sn-glycerol-3-phosphate acyltransferase